MKLVITYGVEDDSSDPLIKLGKTFGVIWQ
jgi:hypothetical protein